ncbi:flagellar protein FliT [Halobacillus litoralis]|uniref:flagellar protein FliT n=1 Tax=Halobacillus litoralis TaxID=45668 RepID=UPI001CFD7A08|nr:flagellar protein FliT [Halobacillus litoralis]
MTAWNEFLTVTEELNEVIHQPVTEKNRTDIINRITNLLANREELLEVLPQPEHDEQRAVIQKVKEMDLQINQKLGLIMVDLKKDIRNVKKQPSTKQRYVNPYKSVSTYDGMYVDHKK